MIVLMLFLIVLMLIAIEDQIEKVWKEIKAFREMTEK